MEEVFISKIYIKKVRHLENIEIPLSETERKHLILTGKNGSGKTSVLESIRDWMILIDYMKEDVTSFASIKDKQFYLEKQKMSNQIKLSKNINDEQYKKTIDEILSIEIEIDFLKSYSLKYYEQKNKIEINWLNINYLRNLFLNGSFLVVYFNVQRLDKFKTPSGIDKIDFKPVYQINDKAGAEFIQYIVNLKADRSFAKDENDLTSAQEIDNWFEVFEKNLSEIFGDKNLVLTFDRKNYTFRIVQGDGTEADFNTLSDGYSAILNVVTELIMRMENKNAKSYDIQGIVLIDEIETHLHIELQKKILPFLTSFFPKIQFIVTTHSPFVLSSIENAVVYDLEKKVLVEDMSSYSLDAIVESYFDSDKYSKQLNYKVQEYERLSNKEDLTETEEDKLDELEDYFKSIPKFLAPELELKITQIRLAQLNRSHD